LTEEHDVNGSEPDAGQQERVKAGLELIRNDVARQVQRIGAGIPNLDASTLPRFAPDLPQELSQERIAELELQVAALEPWLQGPFVLAGNFVIPGLWRIDSRWAWLEDRVGDLGGARVLDIGTNAGYDAFMFKLRGASEVLACDPHEFIEQAHFLESIYRSGVEFRQLGWQQLDPEVHGRFDFVHCHGVLYHELHPMAMLQKLRAMVSDAGELMFGSMLHASAEQSEYVRFVPDAYAGDASWWFVPGRLAMRWMLETVGFEVEELLLSEGPRGEFPTLNSYFRCRPTEPAPGLGEPLGSPS
jgi:2-polyprenyl-3-methyl-5-hydroxy-6-metoxy-1,4-benzoquinol methylase